MLRRLMFGLPVFAAVVMLFASSAATQPPGDKKGKGGPKGGAAKFELGQVLPPALLADLNLTTEQMKELDALKADLKTKLEKLLTDEQKKKVEAYRPTGPGSGDKSGKGKKGPPTPAPVEEVSKNDAPIQWFATLSRGLEPQPRLAAGKPRRPQEPSRPYPYVDEEITFENKQAKVRFAGTLTFPKSGGPFPVALLITGSGERDRDESINTHKPFWVLADYLTRKGIAVLRVDDRGVGRSGGSNALCTSSDFADDVIAGVEYLKGRKEINSRWIGVIGHSEGGLIGPLAATRSKDIAFVVMMAGPGAPFDEMLIDQDALISRASGASAETIAKFGKVQRRMYAVIKSEKDNAIAEKKIRAIVAEEMADVPESEIKKMASQDILVKGDYGRTFRGCLGPWFRFLLNHDPQAVLMKVPCPTLALLGENDRFVSPPVNSPLIEKALKAGGNKASMVKVFPGVNHMFQTNRSENYAKVEETIAPLVLETMAMWIAARTVEKK